MKKLQIYDLIAKGQVRESKILYSNRFNKYSDFACFRKTNEFFKLLFDYERNTELIKKYYSSIMTEFFDEFENDLIDLLGKYSSMYLKRNENGYFNDNDCYDVEDFLLFETEELILDELMNVKESSTFFYNQLSYEFYIIQSQPKNEEIKYKDITIKIENNQSNNINRKNEFKDFNTDSHSNSNIQNNIQKKEDQNEKVNVIINDKYSNFNLQKKKTFKQTSLKRKFKFTNDFLKKFSPKFMKKENLDKRIIRRFKKYLTEKLISIGVIRRIENTPKNYDKVLSNEGSNITYNILDDNKTLKFAINFAIKNTIPPFKTKDISFKSLSCDYLKWVFSDHIVNRIYSEFKNEYGSFLKEELVDLYSLKQNEPNIIEPLENYIKIMNQCYCKMNVEENESLENETENEYFTKINLSKIENVQEKCLSIRRNRVLKITNYSKKSINSDLSKAIDSPIDNSSTDCSQNYIEKTRRNYEKSSSSISKNLRKNVFSIKKVYSNNKNCQNENYFSSNDKFGIENQEETFGSIFEQYHYDNESNYFKNDNSKFSKFLSQNSPTYGFSSNYISYNGDYSQNEMSEDKHSNQSYKDFETFFD